jgi:putative MFS transporter
MCTAGPNSFSSHYPLVFWLGRFAIISEALLHLPTFMMGGQNGYKMVEMAMDTPMLVSMAMIPFGVLLSDYRLIPRITEMKKSLHGDSHFQVTLSTCSPHGA